MNRLFTLICKRESAVIAALCLLFAPQLKAQITNSSFEKVATLTAGTGITPQPQFLSIADLDGDGKPDIVSGNKTDNSISVFQNNCTLGNITTSGFTKSDYSAPSSNANIICITDLDGDGKKDVGVIHTGPTVPTSFSVFKNTTTSPGAITLDPRITFSAIVGSSSQFADVDGDSKPDLVAIDFDGNKVRIYQNTSVPGTISFSTTPVIYSTNAGPGMVEVEDLNGDGKPDLVITCYNSNNLINLFQNASTGIGSFVFTASTSLTAGTIVNGLKIADLNNDGKKDIVAANYSANSLSIFKNNSGTSLSFGTAVTISTGLSSPQVIAIADFDQDGFGDIAVGNRANATVRIYRNRMNQNDDITTSSFNTRGNSYAVGAQPAVYNADIDGDGKIDIVTANNTSGTITILKNTITPSNLVAYYPFMGNAGDSSGFGNHGSTSAGAALTRDRKGIANSAYSFNGGSNAKIEVTPSSCLNTANMKEITMSCWFKPSGSQPQERRLIAMQDNVSTNYELVYNYATRKLRLINFNGPGVSFVIDVAFPTAIDTSVWNHVAVTMDSLNNIKFYLNGTLDTAFVTIPLKPSNPSLIIGNHRVASWNFSGLIDEVRIYNKALSSNEIQQQLTQDASALFVYYPLNGNANDSSGNNLHGNGSGIMPAINRFGEAGKAYYFNGTNANIEIPTTSMAFNSYTYAVWLKIDTLPANGNSYGILSIGNSTLPGDQAITVSNNYSTPSVTGIQTVSYYTPSTPTPSNNTLSSDTLPTTGKWCHVVSVRDSVANKISLYINGVKVKEQTLGRPAAGYSTPIRGFIGCRSPLYHFFRGTLDDVKIYSKALNAADVLALYDSEKVVEGKVYYSKSTGVLDDITTWGVNPDGSGTSPLNFDSSNVTYIVKNNVAPSLSGNWTINGVNSVVVLGDGSNAFNLLVPSANTITCDSVYVRNNITFSIQGNVSISKLGAEAGSTVQFISSGAQNIIKGSYYNLSVSGNTKTLTGATTVKNTLNMLASIDCASNVFTIGASTSQPGTLNRTSGSIIGSLTRWVNTSSTTVSFPVGTTSTSHKEVQLSFTAAPSAGGTLTAGFVQSAPGNTGLPLFDFPIFIDKASPLGYWKLNATNGLSGGTYNVSVTASGIGGVTDSSQLRLLTRNTGGAWTLAGTHIANSGTNAAPVVSRTGVSGFNIEFGIGADQSVNPLPVKLILFTAKAKDKNIVNLDWKTSSEINNHHFDVERSEDGKEFVKVGEVKGGGTTNRVTVYSFTDKLTDVKPVVFYRLKQVDNNGDFTYSDVVSVKFNAAENLVLYPNPSNGMLHISGLQQEAVVSDLLGNEVMKISGDGIVDVSGLKQGVYFIRSGNTTQKLIRN